MLEEKFLATLGDRRMYPPVQNCGPFLHASGFQTKKYYQRYYHDMSWTSYYEAVGDGESFATMSETLLIDPARIFFLEYIAKPALLEQRLNRFEQQIQEMDGLYRESNRHPDQQYTWEEALQKIDAIFEIAWDAKAAMFFSLHFDKEFCWNLLQTAQFALTRGELEEVWERAIHPVAASFDKTHLLDVAIRRAAGDDWMHTAVQCQYIGASYFDVKNLEVMEQVLQERYAELSGPIEAQKVIAKETEELRRAKADYERWLTTLSPAQQVLVRYLQAIIAIRDRRKNFFFKGFVVIWRITQSLFRQAGIIDALIPYYTRYELANGERYLQLHAEEVARRKNGFAILIDEYDHVEMEFVDFLLVKKYINDAYMQSHAAIVAAQEIKGQIGCPGIVRGRARVILNPAVVNDFASGDILVAGMTRPEYVPLMKRAAAIVTDEGGITCHAAIVSRELGKPCVIGTKIATKLIKDGDEVEVDANNGVVKIVSRAVLE